MIVADTSVWIEYLRRGEHGWAGLVRGDLLRDGFPASITDVAIAVSATQVGALLWSSDAAHERVVAAMPELTLRYQRG